MTSLWLLVFGSPIKIALWLGNRAVTWTGLAVLWRRLHGHPQRVRHFAKWGALINLASFGVLAGLLWWVALQ